MISSAEEGDDGGLQPGDRVDSYIIEGKLGAGGFAQVYRARHGESGRMVALKMLNAEAALDKTVLRRFVREAEAVNLIDHPNIVQVLAYGDHARQPFIVMELLDGETLAERVKRKGPIEPREAAAILVDVTQALARAHDNDIIHRDLKPENLFLAGGGDSPTVRVLDFGIAKFSRQSPGEMKTATRAILGTLHTMSPEQCRGSNIDHRSDIYSLGVVAYFILAGEYPFAHAQDLEIAVAHLRETPKPLGQKRPSLPADLAAIVDRCLQKDPARRFQSMRELRDALLTTHVGNPERKRARMTVPLMAAAVVLIALGAWWILFMNGR